MINENANDCDPPGGLGRGIRRSGGSGVMTLARVKDLQMISIIRRTMHAFLGAAVTAVLAIAVELSPAQALVMTNLCAQNAFCTLEELTSQPDATIQVDDKLFSNWNLIANTSVFASAADLTKISVNPEGQTTPAPGLNFGQVVPFPGELGVGNGASRNLKFEFDVSLIDDGRADFASYRIVDNELFFVAAVAAGEAKIDETVFDIGGVSSIAEKAVRVTDLMDQFGFGEAEFEQSVDSAIFSPRLAIHVVLDVNLTSLRQLTGTTQSDINEGFGVTFSQTQITISQIPEPGTVAIFALGLTGLGFLRRRRLN